MKIKNLLNKHLIGNFTKVFKPRINFTYYQFCTSQQGKGSNQDINNFDVASVEKSASKRIQGEKKERFEKDDSMGAFGKTLITTELLSKLIGSKHYPSNNEIRMDPLTIVKVFNENDENLGNKTLSEVFEDAKEIGKDVVLRNDKSNPPVVKIMRYKIELVKRLLRKLSKNKDFKLSEAKSEKFMAIPINIEQNDLITKTTKCRELLKHFSHLKLAVFCPINDSNFYKAQTLLNHIAEDLNDVSKISSPVAKSFQKKADSRIPKTEEELEIVTTQERHDKLEDEAIGNKYFKNTDDYKLEDVEFNDSIVIELESMLVDTSGIDYEMVLESKTVEDIFNGLKNNNFNVGSRQKKKDEPSKGKTKSSSTASKLEGKKAKLSQENVDDESSEQEEKEEVKIASFQEQLIKLERTLEAETDLSKRLSKRQRIVELKKEIYYQKVKIRGRLLLKKTIQDFFKNMSSKKANNN